MLSAICFSLDQANILLSGNALNDDKLLGTQMWNIVTEGIENIVSKGENAGNQHFLLSRLFSKALLFKVVQCLDSVIQV